MGLTVIMHAYTSFMPTFMILQLMTSPLAVKVKTML